MAKGLEGSGVHSWSPHAGPRDEKDAARPGGADRRRRRLKNYTVERYGELCDRIKNDTDCIASGILTDSDIEDPTQIPVECVALDYKN